MIRIGLTKAQKIKEIENYLSEHKNINDIVVLNTKQHDIRYKLSINADYVEYNEWEMYRTYYPLLERINENTLIIVDEPFRTKKYQDLKYNCAVAFCNQTPHRIIFSTFPIIEDKEDLKILLKFEHAQKTMFEDFNYVILQTEDIKIVPRKIKLNIINVPITEEEAGKYEKKKEELFANIGEKNPNTIPRNLQLLAGDFKKKAIKSDKYYLARNERFKKDNVYTYKKYVKEDYIIIDFHYSQIEMMDFYINNNVKKINYLATSLSIDNHICTEFQKWKARCEAIYAKANIYK